MVGRSREPLGASPIALRSVGQIRDSKSTPPIDSLFGHDFTQVQVNSQRVQRSARFQPGTEEPTLNLALQFSKPGFRYAGNTTLTLNGGDTTETPIEKLINKPKLGGKRNQDGSITCWVAAVSENVASAVRVVPQDLPEWIVEVPKSTIKGALSSEKGQVDAVKECVGGDKIKLVAKGDPSSKDLRDSVIRHEKRHEEDDKQSFYDSVGAWDSRLAEAMTKKTEFYGMDGDLCGLAIYEQLGTPKSVATNLTGLTKKRSDEFHKTTEGKDVEVSWLIGEHCNYVTITLEP
jgi:hypothetical protein